MPPVSIDDRVPSHDGSGWQFDDWLALSFAAFLLLTPPILIALCVYAFNDEADQWVVAVPAATLVAVSQYLSRASIRRRCR